MNACTSTCTNAMATAVADHARAHDAARAWSRQTLSRLQLEAARSADTHRLRVDLPGFPGIDV